MEKIKSHPVHELIQKLKPTEKAHFKKFGFRSKSKLENNFKILFDLLDKQEFYDHLALGTSKKLEKNFTKNLHANLYKLYHKILAALVESKSEIPQIKVNKYINQYNVLYDLGLTILAEKELIRAIEYAEEHGLMFTQASLYQKISIRSVNSAATDIEEGSDWLEKLDTILYKIVAIHEMNKLAIGLNKLIEDNSGVVIKSSISETRAKELLVKGQELMKHPQLDFNHLSILFTNIMILESMIGFGDTIKQDVHQYIDLAKKGFKKIKLEHYLVEATISFSLFPSYCMHLGYFEEALALIDLYNTISPSVKHPNRAIIVAHRKLNLDLLEMEFSMKIYDKKIVDKAVATLDVVGKESVLHHELLNTLLIVLMQQKEYSMVTELATDFLSYKYNTRVQDIYITIKMIAALAWYKLEEMDVFESMFRSIYRQLLQSNQLLLHKELVLIFRALSLNKNEIKAAKIRIENVIEKVFNESFGYQKMRATELKLIAECI